MNTMIIEDTIRERATELEKEIRLSKEYIQLKEAYQHINEDEMTKKLFDNFRKLQESLQKKQMANERPTEEEITKLQNLAKRIQENERISKLLEAEQRLGFVIDEINKIFMKPMGELYGDMK
ncbi:hypothetical protein CSV79_05925 [Sporosarcina sp. P13]|uniref:YlbF family regulator n=1 Tax=Sporosarcina sp. P13 TaxID=2048263 RepID=UPI000C168003|nr:YlbF family regulator [Sporosarcina sp. P13]PIC64674.1 hypothetical protein CSV79_05925 [Sporosarcina sp. P13]